MLLAGGLNRKSAVNLLYQVDLLEGLSVAVSKNGLDAVVRQDLVN